MLQVQFHSLDFLVYLSLGTKPESQQAKQGLGESLFSFDIQLSVLLIKDWGLRLCGIRKMVLKTFRMSYVWNTYNFIIYLLEEAGWEVMVLL